MIDDPTARPDPRTPPDETAGPGVLPDAECLIGTSLDHARRATDHHHLDPVRAAGRPRMHLGLRLISSTTGKTPSTCATSTTRCGARPRSRSTRNFTARFAPNNYGSPPLPYG